MPARTDVASATIVADRSLDCDGYSTTVLMLGMDEGLAFAESSLAKALSTSNFTTQQESIPTICLTKFARGSSNQKLTESNQLFYIPQKRVHRRTRRRRKGQ